MIKFIINFINNNKELITFISSLIFGFASLYFGFSAKKYSKINENNQEIANSIADQSKNLTKIANEIAELNSVAQIKITDISIFNRINYSKINIQNTSSYYQLNLRMDCGIEISHGQLDTVYLVDITRNNFLNLKHEKGYAELKNKQVISLSDINIILDDYPISESIANLVLYLVIIDTIGKANIYLLKVRAKSISYIEGNKSTIKINEKAPVEFAIIRDKYLLSSNYNKFIEYKTLNAPKINTAKACKEINFIKEKLSIVR
ncbi:hypothetical protein NM957_08880 [Limosilactobacillus reuteri]|uniref:hypothetical protein n=1 Tax=Limosilactobacillus reuteri TaxID=1598 RepID=UPI0037C04E00